MTIVLVGGSGFIGSSLARRLESSGQDFRIIDLKESPFYASRTIIHDIRKPIPAEHFYGASAVVHLAAAHRDDIRDPNVYLETNVTGTKHVCETAAEVGVSRLIFTSSVAVYGFAPVDTGEDGEIAPFNDYGRTKFAAENVLRDWLSKEATKRSLVIVRPTVVFGPGNRGNVYNLLRQVHSGRFVMVGDGKNRKSMAFVENVAAFLDYQINASAGYHLHNYVDKPDYDMNTLISTLRKTLHGKEGTGPRMPVGVALTLGHALDFIARLSGRSFPLSAIRVRKFFSDTAFTSSAHDVPGFLAPVAIGDGLQQTLQREFFESDPNSPVFLTE